MSEVVEPLSDPDPKVQPEGSALGRALAVSASLVRLHIVAIACLACSVFGWAMTGRWWWLPLVCCALDWFVINLLNRVADLEEDAANGILGADVAARHPRAFSVLCGSVLVGSLIASHLLLPALTPWRLACHAIGFPYNFRLLPGGRRFKELYGLKNLASGVIFLITSFGYPLAAAGGALLADVSWLTVGLVAGYFLLFELSYEVIYDLRDAPGDALAKVPTFPVVHGELVARRIIDGLILSSIAIMIGAYATGNVPWRLFVMILAPVLQLFLYKRIVARGITSADCVRLTWLGAIQLALYHGWVLLDLPLDRPF
ncbi:MAG: UbiA family prenyltransferase [Planctomycetes bacterium]|nr:UbiA family prenyltransferase [Planctomycetota bacterium]